MKYLKFEIVETKETGQDPLGNPTTKEIITGTFSGRFSSWTAEDIAILGREITISSGKVLTVAPMNTLKTVNRVRYDGKIYDIERIPDLGRWRALYLKGWKA